MARIRPGWTPSSDNAPGQYTFGLLFSATSSVSVRGVWWYQPATGSASDVTVSLYTQSGPTLLTSATLLAANVTAGAWNLVQFSSPYTCSPSTGYAATTLASGQQGYESSDPFPITAGPITASDDVYSSGNNYPTTTWSGMHGLDVEWAWESTLTGTTTPSGAIQRAGSRALAGTTTPTAGLVRSLARTLGGTTAPTGAIARALARTLGGTTTPLGGLARRLARALGGTATPSGVVTAQTPSANAGSGPRTVASTPTGRHVHSTPAGRQT